MLTSGDSLYFMEKFSIIFFSHRFHLEVVFVHEAMNEFSRDSGQHIDVSCGCRVFRPFSAFSPVHEDDVLLANTKQKTKEKQKTKQKKKHHTTVRRVTCSRQKLTYLRVVLHAKLFRGAEQKSMNDWMNEWLNKWMNNENAKSEHPTFSGCGWRKRTSLIWGIHGLSVLSVKPWMIITRRSFESNKSSRSNSIGSSQRHRRCTVFVCGWKSSGNYSFRGSSDVCHVHLIIIIIIF